MASEAAAEQAPIPTAGNVLRNQVIAAGAAGMLADSITYPMMTVKSRLQVQGGGGGGYSYNGPLQAILSISRTEGLRTFYKGYGTVLITVPSTAIYMGTYQTFKALLPGGQDNPVIHFTGGLLATLLQSSVSVPMEVIRQRQMVQGSGSESYKGSIHTVKTVYQQEGIMALYRGFLLAQLVWGPYNAMYLPLWEAGKRTCVRLTGAESVEKLAVQYELGSAFAAASFAAAATNPMDIVKTRLQVQGKSNVQSGTHYTGTLDAARKIFAKEGMAGFTRGLTSRVLWVAPSATITFTAFDQLTKRLNKMW